MKAASLWVGISMLGYRPGLSHHSPAQETNNKSALGGFRGQKDL